MANATSTQLQELYVAYFGRAADPTGLDYWTEKGISTSQFAADMYVQAEFKDVYGSLSTEAQVNQIYKNLFDREADVTGLNYWTLQINLGNLKLAEIANHLIFAAKNNSGSEDDKTALTNRTDAAVAYTAKVKESTAAILAFQAESTSPWTAGDNITEAVTYLSGIDKDTAHTTAGIASSVTTITNNGAPGNKKTFTLTTGVDSGASFTGGSSADTFNANLTTNSTNTINSFDELVGGGGTDTLYADVRTAATPRTLTGIEVINATFSGAVTLGLANATSATDVSNLSSTENATFTGIAASVTNLKVENVASDTTTFTYLTTSGTSDSATVQVNNVTGAAAAEISVDGVETLTFNAGVATSSYEIAADAATTLNFSGSSDQTIVLDATTLKVSKFDANSATGAVSLTTVNQTGVAAATDLSVIGGAGNDTLTLSSSTSQDLTVSGGDGNDTIVMTTLATTDTIDGGAGTDTISMALAAANTLDNATRTTFTNVEAITITDAFANDLSTQLISTSIDTVNLTLANAAITAADENIVGPAGSFTVNLGNTSTDALGVLGGALTVTDTGSATTDSVTIVNKAKSSGANLDMFAGNAITATGYENVTLNTGAGTGAAVVDVSILTVTSDDASGVAVSLTLTGTNSIDINTAIVTNSTGLMTIDASGMTAQATGTKTLIITGTTSGTSGTQNITGSPGEDTIDSGNFKATIDGGAGADLLTGGTTIDSILGGAGNDTINGAGGNDTIDGGAGNDTINVTVAGENLITLGAGDDLIDIAALLDATDTVTGGAGTDTLVINAAATASSSEGVSGFEYLEAEAAITQDMVQLTNNTGFTRLINGLAGDVTFNNVYATTTELRSLTGASSNTTTFDRLLDNSSNSLTFGAYTDAATSITSLVVDDEETLTIDDGAINSALALVITDLHAEDLVTLNVTGGANVAITNAIQTQATAVLTTINASANTGTIDIDAANATLALTMTGSATAANTLLAGGSGHDTITGGEAADTLTGNSGNDTLNSGAGADTINGGVGADTINGGAGADVIDAGSGLDSVTGGAGADTFKLYNNATNVTSSVKDVVTDFDASQTDLIGVDISDIEAMTAVIDFTELDCTSVEAAAGTVLSIDARASVDLNGTDTGMSFATFKGNYSSAAELQSDIRTYLTVAGNFIAGDAFIGFYDDGTDTTMAVISTASAIDDTLFSVGVVTDVATFEGVSDCTKIVTANIFAHIA